MKYFAPHIAIALVLSMLLIGGTVSAAKPDCSTTLKDGTLEYFAGHYLAGEIPLGFDIYGYNYQAHMFNGLYANAYLGRYGYPPYEGNDEAYLAANPDVSTDPETAWAWPYRNDKLAMKWNDAWLSNKDCDGDGALDRYYGFDSYIDSGAWLTNHMSGLYDEDCKWNYFTKIVAVPVDAVLTDGIWYTADGVEIGPIIWGQFATILEVSNDPCAGEHGVLYNAPAPTGFGYYMP